MATTRFLPVLCLTGVALASSAGAATQAGDWLLRGRIVNVKPNDQSQALPGFVDTATRLDSGTGVEFDLSFFPIRRMSIELMMTTVEHDMFATGSSKGMGTIGATRLMPPTLTFLWRPLPEKMVRPYVGGGFNYSRFYGECASVGMSTALGGPSTLHLEDSTGIAGQAGMDIDFATDWMLNLDVKYLDVDTTASFDTAGTKTRFDVDVDPWIFGVGVGYRF